MSRYGIRAKTEDLLYVLKKLPEIISLKQTLYKEFSNSSLKEQGLKDQSKFESNLGELFKQYGSDKSTHHNYELVYDALLGGVKGEIKLIVEIGIGSNNLSVPQNMGLAGVPGASLRAFRDWAPKARVLGADVDPKILFSEERILTRVIDQLNRKTFSTLFSEFTDGIDLCVVDGLHTPRAEVNSLLELVPYINRSGYLIIEDISPKAAKIVWPLIQLALYPSFRTKIKKMKNGYVFVLLRKDNPYVKRIRKALKSK
jgi:hypothetical protein